MRGWIFSAAILVASPLQAQKDRASQDETRRDNLIEKLIETITDNVDAQLDFTNLVEDLQYYFELPLDLNQADREDLEKFQVFNDRQIEAILNYRQKFGPFLTIYELAYVPGMDDETLDAVRPFVTVYPKPRESLPTFLRSLHHGKSEWFWRGLYTVQRQVGYLKNKVDPQAGYLGPPFGLFTRFRYSHHRYYSLGFTADKDAGEPFFSGVNRWGFDFYSAHLYVSNLKWLKTLALGDYQCRFGQGLTLWTGLAFGKTAFGINLRRTGQGVRPYTSINENLFMRGGAITLRPLPWLDITAFYSRKKLDGNLVVTDSTDQDELPQVSSLITSGLHRTAAEIDNKGTVTEQMAGGHLDVRWHSLHVGMTGVYTHLSAILNQSESIYNTFRFRGNRLINVGVDYQWVHHYLTFFGEMAYSDNGGWAMIHGLQATPATFLTFTALYRNFQPRYAALYANPVADRRGANNESGFYVGLDCKPARKFGISGYLDQINFPWPRFGIDAPSRAWDAITQLTWLPAKGTEIYGRVRHRLSAQNSRHSSVVSYVEDLQRTNIRLNITTDAGPYIRFRGRAEMMLFQAPSEGRKYGYMIFADLTYKSLRQPFSVAIRYTLFHTQDYDTRIYAYENDLLYYFSIPALYGRGIRTYLTLRWQVFRNLDLWFKAAHTWYADRDVISSGLSQINGPVRTDLRAQVRFKF
ncbi:MAG: helix-hairpin-helix domain-containing protein [Flavobacteriales bacterium]|nr:helix-hairpin-helix domain-containing protein [Flavobacteriales bacterium]MDW8410022.1 helix-hairpin-helix domain-containing protein [Flavobacteriales bacterium]